MGPACQKCDTYHSIAKGCPPEAIAKINEPNGEIDKYRLKSSQSPEAPAMIRFWGRAEFKVSEACGLPEIVEIFRSFLKAQGYSTTEINKAISGACRDCNGPRGVGG